VSTGVGRQVKTVIPARLSQEATFGPIGAAIPDLLLCSMTVHAPKVEVDGMFSSVAVGRLS